MPLTTTRLRAVVMVTLVSLLGALGVSAAAQADAAAARTGKAKRVTAAVVARSDRPAAARAMWVWDTSDAAAIVALATSRGIGQLYAAVPPNVGTSPKLAELRALVALADPAGLRVDALGGDPGWIDNPSSVVTTWLKPALATGLFTGVHVDMEPYNTAAWTTNRKGVIKKYLATLDAFQAAAGSTPIEADIPFWFDEVPAGASTFDREIMKRTDAVTVMAYRRLAGGVDGSITLSANEIRSGIELGRPVRIGQETNHLGDDATSAKQTFHGQTRTQMEEQLSAIVAAYGGSPSFAGLAIHDAVGYSAITD